ncbi:MAG: RNA helicase [Desulfovibrio sp.]|jgi:Mor family transcriptional regulator|nr:RNA helicase [Desulfovibrio sp.]
MQWVSHPELQALLGDDKANILCETFGGVRYYIPSGARPDHPFAPHIGMEAMKLLCKAYGGEKITVPNWRREEPKKKDIISRLEKGESPRSIADALKVTERWVWAVAESVARPKAAGQLSLFAESAKWAAR